MITKSKMKDSDAKSKEWWEIVEEYFLRSWKEI